MPVPRASTAIAASFSSILASCLVRSSSVSDSTTLPLPGKVRITPSISRMLYAFWIVFGLIPSSFAKLRTDGSFSPGVIAPLKMDCRTLSMICS